MPPTNNIALLAIARNAGAGDDERPPVLRMVQSESDPANLLADFGHATDAANFLLAHAGCPPEHRPFIDALIGIAGDSSEWFYASDRRIAARADRSTKTVQRWRNEFAAWQAKESLTLIQIDDNYTDSTGQRHPHRYKVHVARLAVEALEEARRSSRWSSNPAQAIERAAREKQSEIPDTPGRKTRGRKREPDAETLIKSKLKMARTLIEQAVSLADGVKLRKAMFGSDVPFELDGELLAGLRQAVEQLESEQTDERPASMSTSNIRIVDTGGTAGLGDGGQNVHHAEPAGSSGQNVHLDDASRAAAVFEKAGACIFAVTLRDEQTERAAEFEHISNLTRHLPGYLARNNVCLESLVVRPEGAPFIQLDDLSEEARARVEPFSFLSIETSPGNFQAWVVLADEAERDITRRRLIDGTGADRNASGALRWPGSINQKPGRNGFKVRIVHTSPGRITTRAELEAAGLLAPVPPPVQHKAPRPRADRAPRTWPDYQRCLREARQKADGRPDRSDADKNWCILAIARGWPESDVNAKLRELSDKARRRPDYARRTVEYSVLALRSN